MLFPVIYKSGLERTETVPEYGMHQSEQSLQRVMQVNSYTASISNTGKKKIYKPEYREKKLTTLPTGHLSV